MRMFKEIFTWWNSQTLGTRLYTWRKGQYVGTDTMGNIYYQCNTGKRRWVIYKAESEASLVSAEWHGWLHHTFKEAPTMEKAVRKPWEKSHKGNATGSDYSYHPLGKEEARVQDIYRDYEPWSPEK